MLSNRSGESKDETQTEMWGGGVQGNDMTAIRKSNLKITCRMYQLGENEGWEVSKKAGKLEKNNQQGDC